MPVGGRAVRDLARLAFGALLYTLAAPPYEWASAAWFALAPLFIVVRNKTFIPAFAAGFLYGVLSCAGIAGWVYAAVVSFFPFSSLVALLATLASYGFFAGLYTGLAAAFSSVLLRRRRSLLSWIGLPALWVSAEYARSALFAGFSWELLGYTQYRQLALIQAADLTGVYGLSFLLALSGYLVAEFIMVFHASRASSFMSRPLPLPWRPLGCFLIGLALVWGYGVVRLRQYPPPSSPPASRLTVALVQGNSAQTQRWSRVHYGNTLLQYMAITRHGTAGQQPDLVIWPEFAVGFYLDDEPTLRAQLGQLTLGINAPLLLGAPRREVALQGARYYNSAYLLAPGGSLLDVYDKIRLLPFAEFRPPAFPALVNHSAAHPSEFTPGRRVTVFLLPRGAFGVTICYEATYPPLTRQLVRNGAQFLVNISNDSWLAGPDGGGAAAAQHFSMSVLRAVETKRPLVRVATAGVSGFVDPAGRLSHLMTEKEGVIVGEVVPQQVMTVYARYGDWFVLGCVGASLVALSAMRRQRIGFVPPGEDQDVAHVA
jgi:apolipoprotein N-acyltransferase